MSADIVERLRHYMRGVRAPPSELLDEAAAEIVRLRGEVAFAASVIGRYAVESAIRDEGSDTPAPAEAKGDDTLLECTCHYLPFRDCPHIPHRAESQPADGEAVAYADIVTGWSGLTLAVIGHKHFGNPIPKEWYAAAEDLLGRIKHTTQPAAQVQQWCPDCKGTGARPGPKGGKCPACGSSGIAAQVQGRDLLLQARAVLNRFRTQDDDAITVVNRIDKTLAAHPSACELGAVREALEKVAKWELPRTGKFWPSGTECSYEGEYGSQGVRQYFQQLARAALQHRGDSRGGEGS